MFIDKNSFQVKYGSNAYVNLGQYITQIKFGYNKIWGDDTGRNLSASFSGTLLGIFPKFVVSFAPLTKSQIKTITPILDSATQVVKYFDPTKNAYVELQTYTGDYEIPNENIIDENSVMILKVI